MYLANDLDGVGRRALLRAHLHHLGILLLRLHQQCSLSGVVAAWLLYIDVLTRLQPGDGHGGVPVVRAGDADRIHILLRQDLAKILFFRRSFAHRLGGGGSELVHRIAVHIAHVRNASGCLVSLQRR